MRKLLKGLAGIALTAAMLATPSVSIAQEAVDSGLIVYMQMGGNPGDTATLARELGARDAARVLNVTLIEQHSGWDPQKMLTQANEALAGAPDAIIVMGHPGTDAMLAFLGKARADNVIVVANNFDLPGTGVSYFGLDNFGAGKNMSVMTVAEGGLVEGDKALVYGSFAQGQAGVNVSLGSVEGLEEAGIVVDKLQWSLESVLDPALAVPVLIAYLESNPDTKAIVVAGHGGITAVLDKVLKGAGIEPGAIATSGFDPSAAAIQGVKDGYITVILDQQPYLQGYMSVTSAVLEAKYGLVGLNLNTGGGAMTIDNVEALEALIKTGVR